MSLDTTRDEHVTIRFSRPDDAADISTLARLDSARPPQGRLLVAEVAGELAPPFRSTEARQLRTRSVTPSTSCRC